MKEEWIKGWLGLLIILAVGLVIPKLFWFIVRLFK